MRCAGRNTFAICAMRMKTSFSAGCACPQGRQTAAGVRRTADLAAGAFADAGACAGRKCHSSGTDGSVALFGSTSLCAHRGAAAGDRGQHRRSAKRASDEPSGAGGRRFRQNDGGVWRWDIYWRKTAVRRRLWRPPKFWRASIWETFRRLLEPLGVSVELLTGSMTQKQKRERRGEGLANGTISVAVGTHALLSDDVAFARLGLGHHR